MKIGFWGDGPWAHNFLNLIVNNDKFKLAFIVGRFSREDKILKLYAEKIGVPFYRCNNVNSEDFLSKIKVHCVDINVSMSFDQIIKSRLRNMAINGFINCHAGALPFYRGRNVLNWAIINDENKFGITVHYIDAGIDTGDIISQIFCNINPQDDYGTVLAKAECECAKSLYTALVSIRNGSAKRIPQSSIHPVGFYCGRRRDGDEWINWNWESKRIYNFIRGITLPGPCARAIVNGDIFAVVKSRLIENAPSYLGTSGEIVAKTAEGNVVKTGDSTILIERVSFIGKDGMLEKISIPDWAIGTRLSLSNNNLLLTNIVKGV